MSPTLRSPALARPQPLHVIALAPSRFPPPHTNFDTKEIQVGTSKQEAILSPQINMAAPQAVQVFGKKKNATGTHCPYFFGVA